MNELRRAKFLLEKEISKMEEDLIRYEQYLERRLSLIPSVGNERKVAMFGRFWWDFLVSSDLIAARKSIREMRGSVQDLVDGATAAEAALKSLAADCHPLVKEAAVHFASAHS